MGKCVCSGMARRHNASYRRGDLLTLIGGKADQNGVEGATLLDCGERKMT